MSSIANWVHNTVYVIEVLDSDGDWLDKDVTFNEDFAHEQGKEFVSVYEDATDYRVLPVNIKYLS